jgi:hypothetical protein
VHLRVRAEVHGGRKVVRIDGAQFIGRFLQHVLPAGFKRIRHYGLLAPAHKAQRLTQARAALAMPAPNPLACETAAAFMRRVARIDVERCSACGRGHWLLAQQCAASRATLHPFADVCRPQSDALPQAP